ncbi:hypothetical protein [Rhizobium sp. BG4]|uniref:hypothetical protein n=1 Tax=unclassified Rhizobium TaxID=2613769 RepID=UPI001028DF49|nr:hypothetical protein [Rhizobium sp. BG4]QRM42799.1 hypothetical protein F2982_04800 [Rhizobium sp. BG4]
MAILSSMLAGVSQLEEGSDRKRDFESSISRSKYLSEAAAMQKSSRPGDENRRAALMSSDLVELHAACQFEI